MPHLFKRAAAAVAVAAASVATPILAPASPAWAAMPSTLTITGYGYGHGRGMGQYGAYGYAANGWSYQQILGQYYGGTSLVSTGTTTMNAHLVELDGPGPISVTAAGGTLIVNGTNTNKATASITPGQTAKSSTGADLELSAQWWNTSSPTTRYFPGSISFVSGSDQVLNAVTLDQYVQGVVPAEMPASWSAEALKTQAVAARSYALSYEQRNGYNSICDYAACQMYVGDPSHYSPAGPYWSNSNSAVTATTGKVLVCNTTGPCGNAGAVAFTEFSASTGGYTAGGDFPAMPDAGDGEVPGGNAFHPWTMSVARSSVEADYPSIGTLQGIQVLQRNGLGTWGGRVLQMKLIGSSGSVTISGDNFAANLGLYSNWFAVSGATTTPPPGSDTGYWIVGSDGSVFNYGTAGSFGPTPSQSFATPIVGMAPTATDNGYWLSTSRGGVFSYGGANFYGSAGNINLATPVVAIASSVDSGGYWQATAGGGVFSYGDAGFHGSASVYHPASPIVDLVPTKSGNGYWVLTSAGGVFTFGDAGYYGAASSYNVGTTVVGMQRSPSGNGYSIFTSKGAVYNFGDAGYGGSLFNSGQTNFVGGLATPDKGGDVMVTSSGVAGTSGDATWLGDPSSNSPGWSGQVVGIYPV